MKYEVPEINKKSFTCPYCNVLSTQKWDVVYISNNGSILFSPNINVKPKFNIHTSFCDNCNNVHVWVNGKMILPSIASVPIANEYMPDQVKDIYNEARNVFTESAKASAALLRLALQYLCVELGGKGKNINDDIKKLVQDGLPVEVQKALDIIRVTGNNAVHPGTMDLNDNAQIASKLFELINFIVDRMIVQPMEIEKLFNDLPEGALEAINKRDKNNTQVVEL